VVYQELEVSLQNRLMSEFRAAKGLKARIVVAGEILKNAEDLTDKQAAANEALTTLNTEIVSYQRTQPAVALEAVFVRDDLRAMGGPPPAEGEVTAKSIWSQDVKIGALMEQLPAIKHHRAAESFKDSNPEHWHEVLRHAMNTVSAKLCREFAHLLIQEGHLAELKDSLARSISQHTASSELLLWLAKERSDTFADILGPEVFRAMLSAMERDQFNEKRSNRLREYILDDQDLLPELTAAAELEVIKDLTRALQLSPVFDDMDKRSLLARIVKSHPAVQSLISGDQTKQDTSLVVSWDSLERRKNEYADLVHKKIPANSKEIALARSYGDLRENHEYKAAKEMQKVLMRRKDELESQLVRARGTDFSNARTDVVSIGSVVHAIDLATGQGESYTVLGAWDSDPEKGIVSYLSPVAQALLNRKVGEEVEFELHGAVHRHRIERIDSYQAPLPTRVPETPAPLPPEQASEPVDSETSSPEHAPTDRTPETNPYTQQ
jgi:transcription elongation GreA/GreB family factor